MMRIYLVLFTVWAVSVLALAQTAVIKGTVLDAESKRPMEGANVILEMTSLGAMADRDGLFAIEKVPAGSYTLVASFVGYAPKRMVVQVAEGETQQIIVTLTPAAVEISPVIVSANLAKERETPVTFSNIGQKEIREIYIAQDPPAVLSELPSIIQYSENGNGIGYSHITMRGFDQRRVAIMVDGIPQNDPEDHEVYWIDMPDLLSYTQSIQVQRGAGMSFYGPPAIGGSVNIVTTPASSKPGISMTTALGFQEFGDLRKTVNNTHKYGIAVSSGLVDGKYIFFGNLSSITSSGYRVNSWVDLKSYFLGAARFDKTMTTRINVYGGPLTDGLAYNGLPRFYNGDPKLRRMNYNYFSLDSTGTTVSYATLRKPQETENFSQPHYELLHEWRLSSYATLYNTLFYIQGEGYFDYDGDWVAYPDAKGDSTSIRWFREKAGYDTSFGSSSFPSLLLRGFVGNKQWGWMPRAEVTYEDGTLSVGGELRIHRSVHWGKIQYASVTPANEDPDFRFYEYEGEKDMASVYIHDIHHLRDVTTLLVDLQVAYNRYGIRNEKFLNTSFSVPYLFLNPRIGINNNFNDELNGYVSVGMTSREPRLRNLYAGEDAYFGALPQFEATVKQGKAVYDFAKPLAKPEELLDFEVGGGYTEAGTKLTASFFWMEFSDELINNGKLDIFGSPVTGNADKTRHVGVEAVLEQKLTGDLEFSGNLTLSQNRLVSYKEFDVATGSFVSLDDNPIAGFPDFLANGRIRYRAGSWMLSLVGKHVGEFYTDNTKNDQHKIDAYTVFDADVSYEIPREIFDLGIIVRGKVRNLFNELYMAGGQGVEFFPAAERNYYVSLTLDF